MGWQVCVPAGQRAGHPAHYPPLHGPADHLRHCQQEGAQAQGERYCRATP